jgi:hypothetical protein
MTVVPIARGIPGFLLLTLCLLANRPLVAQEEVDLSGRDRPIRVEEDEVYSVGSVAGEDWETFSSITGVAFDGDGNLYLLDRQNFRVVKVGPEGDFLTEMGRAGGGPGEFGMPLGMAVTPGGEVRVYDMGHQGFTVFNPDGSFKSTARVTGTDMFLPNGGLMVLPGGEMVDGGAIGTRMLVMGGGGDPFAPRPVHRMTLGETAEVSTAFEAWNPLQTVGPQREEALSGGGFQIVSPPMRAFDPGLYVGVLPDGRLAVADSTTYAIKLVRPGEAVERILRRPFSPRRVTRRDQNDERERQLAEIAAREESGGERGGRAYSSDGGGGAVAVSGGQVSDLLRARVESMEFGEEIPVLTGMAVDWDGRIWVERTGEGIGDDGPIDLLSAGGEYLGSLPPHEFTLPDAFGPNGLAAWVEADEFDVPVVVVKRLRIQ